MLKEKVLTGNMATFTSRMAAEPITPPDSGSGYAYADMHYSQAQYAQHTNSGMPQDLGFDYAHSYMPAIAPGYSSTYQPSIYQSAAGASETTLPSISAYYEPMGAPILPPLRLQDRMAYGEDYSTQRVAAYEYPQPISQPVVRQAKEEKAVGGVSAKLDYDVDRMTSFVVSTTQHMYDLHRSPICLADIDITRSFQQNVSSPPAFRKWVHQVLSATRLPSATILLSLHYLSDRLKIFPSSVAISENQIYRLLAVALILGSKFLDDNTFINRSWSDVTAIKVSELNSLEIKWLGLIEYGLHVDSSCVQTWVELWTKYDLEQSRKQATSLSPLDTSMTSRSSTSRTRYSPYPTPYSSSTLSSRTFDHTPVSSSAYRSAAAYSTIDPWAPTERPSYEDYYKRSARYPLSEFDEVNNRRLTYEQNRARDLYQSSYQTYPAAPYSAMAAPGHTPSWDTQSWYGSHRADCPCSSCAYRAWKPYAVSGGYNMGTVMG